MFVVHTKLFASPHILYRIRTYCSYILGLVGAGAIIAYAQRLNSKLTPEEVHLKPLAALIAGTLVGFGARMSNGCTSGHGICGLPRMSLRSLSAVGTFMATGALSAIVAANPSVYPMLYTASGQVIKEAGNWGSTAPALVAVLAAASIFHERRKEADKGSDSWRVHIASACCAALFATGLHLSGMTQARKLTSFLNPWAAGGWDPSMMGVMGAGVGVNMLTFFLMSKVASKPLLADELATTEQPGPLTACLRMGACEQNMRMDWKLFLGAAIFGVGWGLSGICPGPGLVTFTHGGADNAWVLPGIIAGMVGYELALA